MSNCIINIGYKYYIQCVCANLLQSVSLQPHVPLSMGFSRQEYWSGLPSPPPGDLPNPGTEPVSLGCPAIAGGFFITSATWGAKEKAEINDLNIHTAKQQSTQN